METILALGLLILLGVVLLRWAGASKRREAARALAEELLPEIRGLMRSSDPHGAPAGAPLSTPVYARRRDDVGRLLPAEAAYAVGVFYGAVEAYGEARRSSEEAFRDASELSLGDRIRAKDRRDRCLKDVYYAGEAAVEKLEPLR